MTTTARALPTPAPFVIPELKRFWDATSARQLLLPRCDDCGAVIWYPRPFCPECASVRVSWFEASGRGTVYSFTVNRRGQADLPEYRDAGAYVLAYVELEEGPRVMTNIIECDPEGVRIGQQVQVVFHDTGQGTALVRFRPTA
ncbi:MAG: Zn-ribbon domain-containing OB-fold protein [Chloroflexota bacterium]|nr:Zn-ribbon domain-containing OB-fold protein [Chloroflexota bacterium]